MRLFIASAQMSNGFTDHLSGSDTDNIFSDYSQLTQFEKEIIFASTPLQL